MNLVREFKKLWNMELTVIPIVIGALGLSRIGTRTVGLGNNRTSGDNQHCRDRLEY